MPHEQDPNCLSGISIGEVLLRLFRFRPNSSDDVTENVDHHRSLEEARREELLDRIHGFLLENKLEVSAPNLLAAHAAFSGAAVKLGRKIELMRAEGHVVTEEWLAQAYAEAQDDDKLREDAETLLKRLSTGLETFTATTKDARNATGTYQVALENHAQSISQADSTGAVLSSLAELTRAMIERTQAMEAGMRKSEEEAATLRKSLERAQRDAHIDHLTGLPNRRAFEAVLQHHYREAQASIEPLSVAFCDIDHFKRINDTHGHDTGDRVIKAIGEVLQRISNENCHVARHGGEEFVMLFRGKVPREAQEVLDAARENLAQRNFVNRATDQPIGTVTFSGGVADAFGYPDPRAALEAADGALYQAKHGGRNQIRIA